MSETEFDFFDGVDVDDIPDNPNELPNNTYKFKVTSAKFAETKGGGKFGITFKYQICEGPWSTFFPLTDWVRVPTKSEGLPKDERDRMLAYLKMRLIGFGYTVDELPKIGPKNIGDATGRVFYGTTSSRRDGDRVNYKVWKFDPVTEDDNLGINTGDDDDPDF
jgi:hypothetical protein